MHKKNNRSLEGAAEMPIKKRDAPSQHPGAVVTPGLPPTSALRVSFLFFLDKHLSMSLSLAQFLFVLGHKIGELWTLTCAYDIQEVYW